MTPRIAVVVPNYNDSRYLGACLRSVLEQAVPPDELVVVDDRSTDGSVALARSILAGVPFARLIENPANLGVVGAMAEGLRATRSEYVLFLSANDLVLPGIFARAKAALARAPGAALWSAMVWLIDDAGAPRRLHASPVVALRDAYFTPQECSRLALRLGGWFGGTTLIYRREMLDRAGGFDVAYGGLSDLFAAMTVASLGGAAYTPEPLAAIRLHGQGYLARTLSDPARVESILSRLAERGPSLSPALFTPAFLRRTEGRMRFAALRASAAPSRWRRLRLAFAFLALRPFDVVPTLWYRMAGWLVVRLRSRQPRSA